MTVTSHGRDEGRDPNELSRTDLSFVLALRSGVGGRNGSIDGVHRTDLVVCRLAEWGGRGRLH